MRIIKTCTLLVLSILLYHVAGLIRIGLTILRDVPGKPGEYELDTWGNMKVNWRSDVFLLLSLVLFVWFLIRVIRLFYRGSRA
jgi:hypothetical protein